MNDDQQRPLWPWIVSMLIGLPVLYVVSFGPACWCCNYSSLDARLTWKIYRPITLSWYSARPSAYSTALLRWCDLFGKDHRSYGYRFPQPFHLEAAQQHHNRTGL